MIAEKIVGFAAVLTLFLVTFPLVAGMMRGDTAAYRTVFTVLGFGTAGVLLFLVLLPGKMRRRAGAWATSLLDSMIRRSLRAIRNERISEAVLGDVHRARPILSVLHRPGLAAAVFGQSLAILAVAALCSQMIFRGLGYDLPFLVNLFAAPVFFLLFLIPVSFGSLGVREGAFIVVYGLFGVPMETALLVSFLNLLGILLGSAVGAVLLWSRSGADPAPENREGSGEDT